MSLPSAQDLSFGLTINGSNDVITIGSAGRYLITYDLNFTTDC